MGLSKNQIKSIKPSVLMKALEDFKNDLPQSIQDKLDPFLNGPVNSIDLSNTNITLGQLCKVIQLITR